MRLGLALDIGLAGRRSSSWTPRSASPAPIFDLDPGVAATRTGTTPVTAIADAAGGALVLDTGTTKPALDASDLLNGHPSLASVIADATQLVTTSGGVTGAAAFTLYAVQKITAVQNSAATLAILGQKSGGQHTCTALGVRSGGWWAGGYDGGVVGVIAGTSDALPHVFAMDYDGTTVRLFVDGVNLVNGSGAFPFALLNGLGVSGWFANFSGAGKLWRFIARAGKDPNALRLQHIDYLARRYALQTIDTIVGVGDSLTFGSLASDAPTYPGAASVHSYLAQLSAQTPMSGWTYQTGNYGAPGAGTTSINAGIALTTVASGVSAFGVSLSSAQASSSARKNSIGVYFGGTNDILTDPSSTADSIIAGITAGVSSLKSVGYRVPVGTLFPCALSANWVPAKAAAVNARIIAGETGADDVIRWDLTPELQDPADATYRNSDGTHPKDLGYGAMARDAAVVLARMRRTT